MAHFFPRSHWITSLVLLSLAPLGCSHPIKAIVGGGMNIGGKMGVDGDIRMAGEVTTVTKTDNTASPIRPVVVDGEASCGGGRIAIVDVDGLLVDRNLSGLGSMGENPVALFREKIRRVEADGSIAAVVLRVNTPGGGVTASDIMANDLSRLKLGRGIPVVACLMTTGCGGGYYLASHADHIVAHPTSVVGGIGVILNVYNLEETQGQYNIVPIPVKSGQKIDTGSPERLMKESERELLQSMANEFHQRFINQVESARGGRLVSAAAPVGLTLIDGDAEDEGAGDEDADQQLVAAKGIFDGRVVTGVQAVKLGLVDRTGYLDDAIEMAGQLAGLAVNAPVVLLRRDNDRALSEFDITPNTPMKSLVPLSIPGLDRSTLPTFLYLWQPEPSFVTAGG